MSLADKIQANTEAVLAGKYNVASAIVGKGGSVNTAGNVVTFNELVAGINSIEAGGGGGGEGGGGGSASYGILPEPVSNVQIRQTAKRKLRITWTNPSGDDTRKSIEIRWASNDIPTIPDNSTGVTGVGPDDTFADIQIDGNEDSVGVWVLSRNEKNEPQTIHNGGTISSVATSAFGSGVMEIASPFGSASNIICYVNKLGDVLCATTSSSYPGLYWLDQDNGTWVQLLSDVYDLRTGNTTVKSNANYSVVEDPLINDLYISSLSSSGVVYKFDATLKTISQITGLISTTCYSLHLGADGYIYASSLESNSYNYWYAATNARVYYINKMTGEAVSIYTPSAKSYPLSFFNAGGNTYAMIYDGDIYSLKSGVFTKVTTGASVRNYYNTNVLHEFEDGSFVLGANANYNSTMAGNFTFVAGIYVFNPTSGICSTFSSGICVRCIEAGNGKLVLMGGTGVYLYDHANQTYKSITSNGSSWYGARTINGNVVLGADGGSKFGYYGYYDITTDTFKTDDLRIGSSTTGMYSSGTFAKFYTASDGEVWTTCYAGGYFVERFDNDTNTWVNQYTTSCTIATAPNGDLYLSIAGTTNTLYKYDKSTKLFVQLGTTAALPAINVKYIEEDDDYMYFISANATASTSVTRYVKATGVYEKVESRYGGLRLPANATKYINNAYLQSYVPLTDVVNELVGTNYTTIFTDKDGITGVAIDKTNNYVLVPIV